MSANISIRTFIVPIQRLNTSNIKILDSDEKDDCEGLVTKEQLTDAMTYPITS